MLVWDAEVVEDLSSVLVGCGEASVSGVSVDLGVLLLVACRGSADLGAGQIALGI